jgi:hypothetical protein
MGGKNKTLRNEYKLAKEFIMNKKILGIAVILLVIGGSLAFAQASVSLDVTRLLTTAVGNTKDALDMARLDYTRNKDAIERYVEAAVDCLLRVQNYENQGHALNDSQKRQVTTINSNINEISQRAR